MIVIEMNPRVSRPVRQVNNRIPNREDRCELAVGCSLNELKNDITRETTRLL